MNSYRFLKTKVSKRDLAKIKSACREFGQLESEDLHLIKGVFGGIQTCEADGVIFILAANYTRPSKFYVFAADLQCSTFYFPSVKPDDLAWCYTRLGLKSESAKQELLEFIKQKQSRLRR